MHIIIYRKSDGKPFLQETISSFFNNEKEIYDSTLNYEHIVKNHGGIKEDYSEIWLEDETIIQKTYTHKFTIVNGEVVFGDEIVIEEPEKEPTQDDYLLDLDYRLSTVELGL